MSASYKPIAPANKVTSKRVIWATFVIALGGLLFGYDSGVISGALPSMTKDFDLDAIHSGMVVSSLVVGAAIGALSAGRISDRFGRRPVLIAASAIFVLGAIIAAFAPNVPIMIVARVILGLGGWYCFQYRSGVYLGTSSRPYSRTLSSPKPADDCHRNYAGLYSELCTTRRKS